jgi:hypothetical protein
MHLCPREGLGWGLNGFLRQWANKKSNHKTSVLIPGFSRDGTKPPSS